MDHTNLIDYLLDYADAEDISNAYEDWDRFSHKLKEQMKNMYEAYAEEDAEDIDYHEEE